MGEKPVNKPCLEDYLRPNCKLSKPGEDDNCLGAQEVIDIRKKHEIEATVTRCPNFKIKKIVN